MQTLSEKNSVKNVGPEAFSVDEALVGIALDRADDALLKYFHFFEGLISIQNISFLHIIPNYRARLPLTVAPGVEIGREDQEKAIRSLSEKVKEFFSEQLEKVKA